MFFSKKKPIVETETIEEKPPLVFNEPDRDNAIAESLSKVYQGKLSNHGITQDDAGFNTFGGIGANVPVQILDWYANQSFLGWQPLVTMSQHWLVNRACTVPIEDAIMNGWEVVGNDGKELDPDIVSKLKSIDKRMNINRLACSFGTFARVFGYRIAIFQCENWTQDDYEAPFNPDGVTPDNRYTGFITPDPYYVTPIVETYSPDDKEFFEPEFWVVNGIKYHKSHCVIYRHKEVAQILKPVYLYGGISLVQEVYEAVYQYGLAIDEINKLLMTKRLLVQHGDVEAALMYQSEFEAKMRFAQAMRNNFDTQILGIDEKMEQLETSLVEVPEVIDKLIERIAAIACTTPNRLLGTQLKGFGSSGDAEEKINNDNVARLQTHCLQPLIDRHTLLTMRSIGLNIGFEIKFNVCGSKTEGEIADINQKKAQTGQTLIMSGAITAQDERNRLINDKNSGYNNMDVEIEQPLNFDDDNEESDNEPAPEIT